MESLKNSKENNNLDKKSDVVNKGLKILESFFDTINTSSAIVDKLMYSAAKIEDTGIKLYEQTSNTAGRVLFAGALLTAIEVEKDRNFFEELAAFSAEVQEDPRILMELISTEENQQNTTMVLGKLASLFKNITSDAISANAKEIAITLNIFQKLISQFEQSGVLALLPEGFENEQSQMIAIARTNFTEKYVKDNAGIVAKKVLGVFANIVIPNINQAILLWNALQDPNQRIVNDLLDHNTIHQLNSVDDLSRNTKIGISHVAKVLNSPIDEKAINEIMDQSSDFAKKLIIGSKFVKNVNSNLKALPDSVLTNDGEIATVFGKKGNLFIPMKSSSVTASTNQRFLPPTGNNSSLTTQAGQQKDRPSVFKKNNKK